MTKLLVVRMRGEIGTRRDIIDTFKMLGMKKMYSFAIIENTGPNVGMIRKVGNFAAWGEPTDETEKSLKAIGAERKTTMGSILVNGGLKSPKGGFKSKKVRYPRGNLGYCEAAINDMVKKMI